MTPPPRNRRRQHPANRRRQRPSATHSAARRHSRWLATQLQRAGTWLRALPAKLRSTADTTLSGPLLRPWSEPEPASRTLHRAELPTDDLPRIEVEVDSDDADAPPSPTATLRTSPVPACPNGTLRAPIVRVSTQRTPTVSAEDSNPALDSVDELPALPKPATPATPRQPRPIQRASEFSKQIAPRALALGRELAPRAADLGRQLGRQLGPLARRGAAATGHGLRAGVRRLADLRPLLRLLGRFFAAIGGATVWLLRGLASGSTIVGDRTAGALQRHQAVLLGLFTRALWWTALVLLFLGGRALVEIHERNPFLEAALPSLLAGLALCAALLLFASQARMRWAAFALGLGHGGLLALVWVVSAIA